ncbi:MAG: hypothetical protein ACOZBH_04645 [Patescibacteria group bacterium]
MDSLEFGLFSIDLSFVEKLANQPLYQVFLYIFFNLYGWVLFSVLLIWGLSQIWMFWRQNVFASKQSYILLAVDIPRESIQTPKAVENVFANLAGAHADPNWKEKYIDGYFQVGFSLEIVSIDGFIQYLIRTPVKFRELAEAAIYAQYPDAEITEVNDYAKAMDIKFPNDEYGLWGSDITLAKPYYYPIRTYPEFEHQMSQEFKDPMASLLEIMSKIGKGEQIWFQILIVPVLGSAWVEDGVKEINKLVGVATPVKKTALSKIAEAPISALQMISEQITGGGGGPEEKKKEANMLAYMPPNQKVKVDGISRKISKIGYKTKMRFIYLSKKEVMRKGLGVSGIFGALKQFNTEDLNSMKPHKKTKTVANYFFINRRMASKQNHIMSFYKGRSMDSYGSPFYLNIEELATLYHFPAIELKAPLIQRIESKKASAPISLPTEEEEYIPTLGAPPAETPQPTPEPVIDFDTDEFEKRFAKDKTGQTAAIRKKIIKQKYHLEEKNDAIEPADNRVGETEESIMPAGEEIAAPAGTIFKKGDVPASSRKATDDHGQAPDNLPFI